MPTGERSALERGAVEGQLFHRGAVAALTETSRRGALPERLNALVEKEFIHPAAAEFVDEAAYRFRHILIRDAAYEAVPKKMRAELHERFADWLEHRAGDRVSEFDEILGYHLEQAYRLRAELGPVTEDDRALALRAAERLGAGGHRAFARRDAGAATNLLLRAADLRPAGDATRIELMESGGNLLLDAGELARAESVIGAAVEEAGAAGNRSQAARLETYAAWIRLILDPSFGTAGILEVTDRVEPILREAADHRGLLKVHDARAYVFDMLRRTADVEREAELAIAHARSAGSRFHEAELYWWLFWQLPRGPGPVDDAIGRCHELRAEIGDDLAAEAVFFESLAELEAMRGRFDASRELIASSVANREQLGLSILTTRFSLPTLGVVELLAGEPAAAESALRRAYDEAHEHGDLETVANAASLLIEALLAQDRLGEAEELVPLAEQAEAGDAVAPLVRSRCARARILSRRNDVDRAEALARQAVEVTRDTDDLNLQGTAHGTLAEVLATAGRRSEAAAAAEAAREVYERKGNVVAAAATRTFLDGCR